MKKSNIKYLKTLKYNGIHSPFSHAFKNTTKSKNLIKKLDEIASLVNARHINFHSHKIKFYEGILKMKTKATKRITIQFKCKTCGKIKGMRSAIRVSRIEIGEKVAK